jgi:hypothetical protein
MDVTLDFTWYKDPKGYRLIPAKPLKLKPVSDVLVSDIRPARIVRNGGALQSYRPFEIEPRLHDQFLKLAKTESGVFKFVETFGPLTHEGLGTKGDVVLDIIKRANDMTRLLRGGIVAFPLGPLQTTILSDRKGLMRLEVRPRSLIDALWLELSQDKSRTEFRKCNECGETFRVGPGARRADARFCSDECRTKHNNERR